MLHVMLIIDTHRLRRSYRGSVSSTKSSMRDAETGRKQYTSLSAPATSLYW